MASSILFWNRLEPQRSTNDLGVALRCEIRDALWMLARQWQMGELRAEDGGTCAFAKVETMSAAPHKLSLRGSAPQDCSAEKPLNFLTEGTAPVEHHSPTDGLQPSLSLDLRVEFGRFWLRFLKTKLPASKATAAINAFKGNPLLHFRMQVPDTIEGKVAHAATLSNEPYLQMISAYSNGRALDGGRLFEQLQTRKASDFLIQADAAVDQLGEEFKKWVTDTFPALAADASSGWNDSRLEYQFDCTAQLEEDKPTVLRVPEHDGSFMDWHTFEKDTEEASDVHPALKVADPSKVPSFKTATLLPRLVSFAGAPRNRWWEMEDSTIDLGNLKPSASDSGQFVLAEFALLYSNDWLVFPLELPVGGLCQITKLIVTDVFGGVTALRPAESSESWGLFSIAKKVDSPLWLAPVATSVTQGPAKEEVLLLRDEMANLAWGIENIVADGLGGGMDGLEAASSTRRWIESALGAVQNQQVSSAFADRRYVLGTEVPENWIPFVPIRLNENEQMRLRRAALPRTIADRPPVRVRPRTQLLRKGLEKSPVQAFDLNEEEITMPGIVVRECWRQARWFDGKMFTWLARQKLYARPARASGLHFDSINEPN